MTLMASMLLLSSTTYAVEMRGSHAPKQMMTMSKADAQQMLDKAGIDMSKAKVLDNGEMVKTDAEGIAGAWVGASTYLGYNTGRYIASGSWGGTWGGFGAAVGSGYALSPW